jgi:hypothetical protein
MFPSRTSKVRGGIIDKVHKLLGHAEPWEYIFPPQLFQVLLTGVVVDAEHLNPVHVMLYERSTASGKISAVCV